MQRNSPNKLFGPKKRVKLIIKPAQTSSTPLALLNRFGMYINNPQNQSYNCSALNSQAGFTKRTPSPASIQAAISKESIQRSRKLIFAKLDLPINLPTITSEKMLTKSSQPHHPTQPTTYNFKVKIREKARKQPGAQTYRHPSTANTKRTHYREISFDNKGWEFPDTPHTGL